MTKEQTWYVLIDKWILAKKGGAQNTTHRPCETQDQKGRSKCACFSPTHKGEENNHEMERKGGRDLGRREEVEEKRGQDQVWEEM